MVVNLRLAHILAQFLNTKIIQAEWEICGGDHFFNLNEIEMAHCSGSMVFKAPFNAVDYEYENGKIY